MNLSTIINNIKYYVFFGADIILIMSLIISLIFLYKLIKEKNSYRMHDNYIGKFLGLLSLIAISSYFLYEINIPHNYNTNSESSYENQLNPFSN